MTNFEISLKQIYDFIDNIEELPGHIVMFYEEPELARMVALRFLKNGLERGDMCVYNIPLYNDDNEEEGFVVVNDPAHTKGFIEQEMQDNGIKTSYYKEKGLLHIPLENNNNNKITITDFNSFRESMEHQYQILLKQFGSESRFPTIMGIGRAIANIKTIDGMVQQLLIENYSQNDNAVVRQIYGKGTWICTYKLNSITEALENDEIWMEELLHNHDAVIYLPRDKNGLALRLR